MASLKDLGLSEASLGKMVKEAAKKDQKMRQERVKFAREDLARAVLRLVKLKSGKDEELY